MSAFASHLLDFMAVWSLQWAVLILLLGLCFLLRSPHSVAPRLWLANLVLIGGLLLPLIPGWWQFPQKEVASLKSNEEASRPTLQNGSFGSATNSRIVAGNAPTPLPATSSQVSSENQLSDQQNSPIEKEEKPAILSTNPVAALPETPVSAPESSAVIELRSIRSFVLQNWKTALAFLWLTGCAYSLLRLVAGYYYLRQIRLGAEPVSGDLNAEFQTICQELAIRRPTELLLSQAVSGPALFGGLRPAVVVPGDWPSLNQADRQASLYHELTHVAYADDRTALFESIIRSLFFFHPLVNWLLNCLACEREKRCDLATIRQGVEPLQLARVLFEGAKKIGASQSLLMPRLATPMFQRNSLTERINHLLEPEMNLQSKSLSPSRIGLSLLAVLAVCTLLGGYTARAYDRGDSESSTKANDTKDPLQGVVVDQEGKPVAEATVIIVGDGGAGERTILKSDAEGKFSMKTFPIGNSAFPQVVILALKDGYAPSKSYAKPFTKTEVKLPLAASFQGFIKDEKGRSIPGASVKVGFINRSGGGASWGYLDDKIVRGTGAEKCYYATTDDQGKFEFSRVASESELIFRVSAKGFAELDTGTSRSLVPKYVVKADAKPAELILKPEARVRGRVISKLKGYATSDVEVALDGYEKLHGYHRKTIPDAEGRFEFDRLPSGDLDIFLKFPQGAAATAKGVSVTTKPDQTQEITLEIIAGVEVTGRVQVKDTKAALEGIQIATLGSINPHNFHFDAKRTSSDGRYSFRAPPGKITVLTWGAPEGYGQPEKSRMEIEIPEGVEKFEVAEPFEYVRVRKDLPMRVVDATGKPLTHAKVYSIQNGSVCGDRVGDPQTTSHDGQVKFNFTLMGPLEAGRTQAFQIETESGQRFEASTRVTKEGVPTLRLPTLTEIQGPQDVKADEYAGLVVDEKGKPLAGAKVHLYSWVDNPQNYTFTDSKGIFRMKDLDTRDQYQVLFSKDQYCPVMFLRQPAGTKGLVIVLDQSTYFEGVVRSPEGKPVAGAQIRTDRGPKMLKAGYMINKVWSETKADSEGRYRFYVQPDDYAFHVTSPGIGVCRLEKIAIGHGEVRKLDIDLQKGVNFRAIVQDSVSGKPVKGLRLYSWDNKVIDARSDEHGEISIPEMIPGEFSFNVESSTHTRWWSEQATFQETANPESGWIRKFDNLCFNLKVGMAPVIIKAEPGVKIIGRVLDPDGKPVEGATATATFTKTGNSLTGDTRFSFETRKDGNFEMLLPASGNTEYNLMVHDGKYDEWRNWANGVLPPIKTQPGQVIKDVVLKLNRPAVVRGKLLNTKGEPVSNLQVRIERPDLLENRYYVPFTQTKADGTFELNYLRAGEQSVIVNPIAFKNYTGPDSSVKKVTLKEGEKIENIILVVDEKELQAP